MSKKSIIILVVICFVVGAAFGGYKGYTDKKLDKMRKTGKDQVAALVDMKDYRKAEQAKIQDIEAEADKKIEKADEQSDVDAVLKAAKADIAELKTDAQYDKEEAAAKAAAKKKAEAKRKAAAKKAAQQAAARARGGFARSITLLIGRKFRVIRR